MTVLALVSEARFVAVIVNMTIDAFLFRLAELCGGFVALSAFQLYVPAL